MQEGYVIILSTKFSRFISLGNLLRYFWPEFEKICGRMLQHSNNENSKLFLMPKSYLHNIKVSYVFCWQHNCLLFSLFTCYDVFPGIITQVGSRGSMLNMLKKVKFNKDHKMKFVLFLTRNTESSKSCLIDHKFKKILFYKSPD